MVDQTKNTGKLFIYNYMRMDSPISDSERARRRIDGTFFRIIGSDGHERLSSFLYIELGIIFDITYHKRRERLFEFWTKSKIEVILSSITIVYKIFPNSSQFWLQEISRIFEEEQMSYKLDNECGVHYLIDENFEAEKHSCLAGLSAPEFIASKHALEDGLRNLTVQRQSGKGLIRGVFEALESAFLVVINEPSKDRISSDLIDRKLKPIIVNRYFNWQDSDEIVNRVLETLKSWVKAVHYYRHGTPLEQIHEPPINLAISLASQGMAHIRFIIEK